MHSNIKNYAVGTALLDILQKSYVAEQGYKVAASTTEKKELKQFLFNKSKDRAFFNERIKGTIDKLDGDNHIQLGLSIKAAQLSEGLQKTKPISVNKKTEINEVINVERATLETFDEFLSNTRVSKKVYQLLFGQKKKIKKDIEVFSKLMAS